LRAVVVLLFLMASLFSSEFKLKKWESGESFGAYLTRHHIDSTKFYNQINPDDIKFLSAIDSGITFFENIDSKGLKEALIPLGEEMQISVFRKDNGEYGFDIIPIKYKVIKDKVSIKIDNSCFNDIKKATNNPNLATYLKKIFKDYVDFTKLQKGDIVSIDYEQKSIDSIPWGEPKIKAAYIKRGEKEYFAILQKGEYKIWANKRIEKSITTKRAYSYIRFSNPLTLMRVTSKFTYKRWHPILRRYRPHLGLDLGAKRGTPIHAIAAGKVIYAGWMRGYGKVTKIAHGGGYVSLYAHQSRILVKVGQRVKAYQVIGRIGSTGRSTGPHLHLGVYKRGKPINPFRVLHKLVKVGNGVSIKKKIVINIKNLSKNLPYKEKIVYNTLTKLSRVKNSPFVWKNLDKNTTVEITIKREIKHANRIKLSSEKGDA